MMEERKQNTPEASKAAVRGNLTEQARRETEPLSTDREDVDVITKNAYNESQQTLAPMEISRERSSSDPGQVKPAVNLGKPPGVTGKFSSGTTVVQTLPNSSTKDVIIGGIKFPGLPEGPVLPSVPTHQLGELQQSSAKHVITDATHNPFADFNLADLPDIIAWQSDNKLAKTEQPAVKAASSLTQQQASSAAAVIEEAELPRQQPQQRLTSLNVLRQQNPEFAAKLYPDVPAIKPTSIERPAAGATTKQHQIPIASELERTAASIAALDDYDYSSIPVVQGYAVLDEELVDSNNTAIAELLPDIATTAAEASSNRNTVENTTARAMVSATSLATEAETHEAAVSTLNTKVEDAVTAAATATEANKKEVAQLYTSAANYYKRAVIAKQQRKDVLSDFLRDAGNVSFYAAEHRGKKETSEDNVLYQKINGRLMLAIDSYDLADRVRDYDFEKNCFYNAGEAYFCAAQLQNFEEENPAIKNYMQAGNIYKELYVDYINGGKFRNDVKVHSRLPLSYKNAADAINRGDESAANLFLTAARYYDKRRYDSDPWITEKLGSIGDCYFEQAMLPENSAAYKQLEIAHNAFETRKSKNKTPWDSGEKAYQIGVSLKSPEEKAQYSNAIKAANRFEQEQEESSCTIM